MLRFTIVARQRHDGVAWNLYASVELPPLGDEPNVCVSLVNLSGVTSVDTSMGDHEILRDTLTDVLELL